LGESADFVKFHFVLDQFHLDNVSYDPVSAIVPIICRPAGARIIGGADFYKDAGPLGLITERLKAKG